MDEDIDNFDYSDDYDFNWNSITYIYGMRHKSRGMMMDVVYKAIIENASLVLNSNTHKHNKISAIRHILEFFENIEQYEKCAELKKIIDKIK
tara:strand:- start:958 stop:1233 length:276 start_codon:yes stop_codon:yes gene_type:complete